MTTRKPIKKSVRFEVFKRDSFTCQYCGATPPAIVLHVDHIKAVADGGENDIDNLVTACEPCNLGKGARALESVPQGLADRAALIAEKEEQLRGYHEVIEARRRRLEEQAMDVCMVYERFNPGYTLSESGLVSVRTFVGRLGVHAVIEAMEIAQTTRSVNEAKRFRYFCGICWNRIRGE